MGTQTEVSAFNSLAKAPISGVGNGGGHSMAMIARELARHMRENGGEALRQVAEKLGVDSHTEGHYCSVAVH